RGPGLRGARAVEAERPEELRHAVRRLSARLRELLRDLIEPLRVALAELDLHLDELAGDAERVHHGDLVAGHLRRRPLARDGRPVPAAPRPRHARERIAPLGGDEQADDLAGRLARPAGLLELEAGVGDRKLQLPQVAALLEPAAQRDPGAGERAV